MIFASPLFLFAFLPLALALYALTPRRARNLTLLCLSLFFYAWGERQWVVVMLCSVAFNWAGAIGVEALAARPRDQKWFLGVLVALDLLALSLFKYADFALENLNHVFVWLGAPEVPLPHSHLPLGISFFTFHAISYVVDVYRKTSRALWNPLDAALYIALFPQLIAGPIIRYHYIEEQLKERNWALADVQRGVQRFIWGLAKKVLIANVVARAADGIFALPPEQLSFGVAWLGVAAYAFQIYFDFSGYSDMAIGLGAMFGFRFPENFNYPYVSRSITEFWRRWHISLSSWFRDYVYIPLGGNRVSNARTYVNLVSVFLLCGLWHGASWTFVLWGALHGAFLVLERASWGKRLASLPRPLQHVYALLVVSVGWVLFRAVDLGQALVFLRAMVGGAGFGVPGYPVALFATPAVLWAFVFGVLASCPRPSWLRSSFDVEATRRGPALLARGLTLVGLFLVLTLSVSSLATHTYNPFIYFRF